MRRRHAAALGSLAAFAALVPLPAAAQTEHDAQGWLNVTVQGPIKDRLIYFAEVQPRLGSDLSRLDALLLRPAIGWRVSDRVSVYQGYVRVITPVDGGRDRAEHRPFQQLTWTLPYGRGALGTRGELQSRTRLEQRWRNDGNRMGLRLREMVRGEWALAADGTGVRAMASAELFWALRDTDWGNRAGFDQLRTFGGVELPLFGRSTAEVGYLNQLIDQPGPARRMNHAAVVNIFLRH